MQSFIRLLLPILIIISLNGSALISQTIASNQQHIQNSKANSDSVVVECVAERLGMQPKDVRLDLSIPKQPKPGDDLDFIEILASIEESLNIEINDEMLSQAAGAGNSSNLTEVLTIKQLQSVVKKAVTK